MSLYYQYCYCTFFYKNYTANHRSFQLFSVVYVLYIITNVFGKNLIKIIPRIIAVSNAFFCGMCPYIINTFFLPFYKKIIPQFAVSVSPLFFRDLCPYIINRFLHILSRYDTFFNVHLYLFINCHLRANQSVYICYKYLLKWLNKAILSTFLPFKTTALPIFENSFI